MKELLEELLEAHLQTNNQRNWNNTGLRIRHGDVQNVVNKWTFVKIFGLSEII